MKGINIRGKELKMSQEFPHVSLIPTKPKSKLQRVLQRTIDCALDLLEGLNEFIQSIQCWIISKLWGKIPLLTLIIEFKKDKTIMSKIKWVRKIKELKPSEYLYIMPIEILVYPAIYYREGDDKPFKIIQDYEG